MLKGRGLHPGIWMTLRMVLVFSDIEVETSYPHWTDSRPSEVAYITVQTKWTR